MGTFEGQRGETSREGDQEGEGKDWERKGSTATQVLPVHTRCHANAALSHHLLDAFQSYHLGLCNGINDIFCSKFVQIWRGKKQGSWAFGSMLHSMSAIASNTLTSIKPCKTMALHDGKTSGLGVRQPS